MMECQKRQRQDTTTRFKRHLKKVRSIANKAFAALPDISLEEMAKTQTMYDNEKMSRVDSTEDADFQKDCAMCEIIDNYE